MKNFILAITLLFTFNVLAADSKGVDVTVNLSPAGSFHIQSKKVKGKLNKKGDTFTAKELSVKIKSLKTGIELRDDHMKKRLAPEKHPSIIVSDVIAKNGKGKGKITIKGIKKAFSFNYKTNAKLMMADFTLDLNHFKVKDLKYMGVGAKNIVHVKANIPIK